MNQGILKSSKTLIGALKEQKGKIKQKLAVLTNNEALYRQGTMEEMTGRLQMKLDKSEKELNDTLFNQ